jgi:uncharacterized membrane protein
MEPDAADSNPTGRQPNRSKKGAESAPFDAHSDSEEHTTVLQIVLRVPERRIAWQAISDNFPRGVILFEPLSDRSTQITVRLRSSIEPAKLAKVTRDYLTNFKRFVEQG